MSNLIWDVRQKKLVSRQAYDDSVETRRQQQQQAEFNSYNWADGTTDEEKTRAIETLRQNFAFAKKDTDIANAAIEAGKNPAPLTFGEKLNVVGEVVKDQFSDTGTWEDTPDKIRRGLLSAGKGVGKGLTTLATENLDANPIMGGVPYLIFKDAMGLKQTGTNLTPGARAADYAWKQKVDPAANELLGLKNTNFEKSLGTLGEFAPALLTGRGATKAGEQFLLKNAPKLAEKAAARYLAKDIPLMAENYAVTQTPLMAEERQSPAEFAAMWMAPNLIAKGAGKLLKAPSEIKSRGLLKAPGGISDSIDYLNQPSAGAELNLKQLKSNPFTPIDRELSLKRQPPEIQTLNKGMGEAGKVEHAPEAFENPEFAAANELSKVLSGRGVVPFKGRDNIHGASDGKNIYLNAKTDQPMLYVTSHELTHDLQANAPEVYARLENIVLEHVNDVEGLRQHYTRNGYKGVEIPRELTADATAECMMDGSFWARVRQQSPELLKPVLDALDGLITKFRQAIGQDMTILPYLKDVEVMRGRLADEYAGFLADAKAGKAQASNELAAKRDVAYKFTEKGSTSPSDDFQKMVLSGSEHLHKGGRSQWVDLMKKDFPDAFDKPYTQQLLTDARTKAEELRKTGQTAFRYGGQEIPIKRSPALDEVAMSSEPALNGNALDVGKGELLYNGQKPRSLNVSAAESPWANPEYVDRMAQDIAPNEIGAYDPISNKQTIAEAQDLLAKDPGAAVRRILDESRASDRVDNTAGLMLVKAANDSGDIGLAVDLTEALAKKATEAGQAVQALSMWGKLTPEGMLAYGQKVIARANRELIKNGVKKPLKLDEEAAKKILQHMKEAEKLEGDAKNVKVQQALGVIAEQVPPSIGKKIATFQTMMQLLNLKTATRNIVGNFGFGVMENISDVVGTGLDKMVSGVTKNRTKALPSLLTQGKGFIEGGAKGIRDANLGIDTSNMAGGKFDLPTQRVFTSGPLSTLEKAMNFELRVPDRAFYQAAYNESLRQQVAAAAKSNAPRDMKLMEEQAHYDALYRTFQDDSAAASFFSGMKRLLNDPIHTMGLAKGRSAKEFGLGDFIIKYPKTPGNLLSRGIEYSPAGFIKTVMELGRPLFGREFNQKAFVESASRAFVGSTALVGTGALLHKVGIITGGPDSDKDVEGLNAQAGYGQYRINVSALKRFVASGFDPNEAKLREGDITISYDWFQPDSIGLAMGADIDKNKNKKKGLTANLAGLPSLLVNGLSTGINAFAEQPVISGLMQISGYNDSFAGLANALQGVPASFVPTLFNQIKQLTDNDKRSTYSPDFLKEAGNKVINKLPGASKALPQQYGTLGQPLKTYQEGSGLTDNNPFNVLINPSFVNQYKPMPEAQKALDIYGLSGEKSVLPPVKQRYITYTPAGGKKSERIDLTPEEYAIYQQIAGEYARDKISKLNVSGDAATMVKKMNGIISDASDKAKDTILGARGIKRKK